MFPLVVAHIFEGALHDLGELGEYILRECVEDLCRTHIKDLFLKKAFEQLLSDMPELSVEVLKAVVAERFGRPGRLWFPHGQAYV